MSPLPTTPTISGESWEMVETSRAEMARELDTLIAIVGACECPHAPDAIEHFDDMTSAFFAMYGQRTDIFSGLLAEAVGRLAAARKAGEL